MAEAVNQESLEKACRDLIKRQKAEEATTTSPACSCALCILRGRIVFLGGYQDSPGKRVPPKQIG